MTDQADTPDAIGEALALVCGDSDRPPYRVLAEHVPALAAEVRALRAENERLTDMLASDQWPNVGAVAATEVRRFVGTQRDEAIAERDSALAELAAARDREAAVRALADRLRTKTPPSRSEDAHGLDRLIESHDAHIADAILAALSQSEPTKERSE